MLGDPRQAGFWGSMPSEAGDVSLLGPDRVRGLAQRAELGSLRQAADAVRAKQADVASL